MEHARLTALFCTFSLLKLCLTSKNAGYHHRLSVEPNQCNRFVSVEDQHELWILQPCRFWLGESLSGSCASASAVIVIQEVITYVMCGNLDDGCLKTHLANSRYVIFFMCILYTPQVVRGFTDRILLLLPFLISSIFFIIMIIIVVVTAVVLILVLHKSNDSHHNNRNDSKLSISPTTSNEHDDGK